ncbi:MAG: Wzz/FepE/Etk N-terminal domain-containing protein [Pyrinomonadaceae bacterium]
MSAEFRNRTAGEIVTMIKRRKWLIILPVITVTAAFAYTVYKLPSVYESTTLLTVKPPMISDTIVRPLLSEDDISQRIQSISTEVLSRSTLEPMITKYNLFERERNQKVPMELIIEQMRKNIQVEFKKTDRDNLASFEIRYRDRTPEAARNVASDIASKYVTAAVKDSTDRAKETQEFVETARDEKKAEVDAIAKQRLDIMKQNVETLPDSAQGLIAQLEGLRKSDETLGREIQSLNTEKGRINEQIGSLNRDIRLLEGAVQQQTKETISRTTRIEDTPAYATTMSELTNLRAELDSLLRTFREKHPKVLDVKNKIAEKEQFLAKLRDDGIKRANEAEQSSDRSTEIQKARVLSETTRLQAQIRANDQEIALKERQRQMNSVQIAQVEAKINTIPNVRVLLESVDAQYDSAKKAYDEYEKTRNDANLTVNRESKAQGETISVVDSANLPKSPVAPKREVLTMMGAGLGLALGFFLAGLFEIPMLFKVQNIADAKHYTSLPLLAAVPPLLTPNEIAWNKRTHYLKVMAGISFAIGMIPILILIIKFSGILQSVVS